MKNLTTPTRRPGAFVLLLLVAFLLKYAPTQAQALTVTDDVITLTTQPTGSSATTGQNFTGSDNNGLYTSSTPLGITNDPNMPPTPVPQLGTYDLNNNSALIITGAQMQGILGSNQTTITSTRLEYRVYLTGTATTSLPNYTNLTFTTSQTGTGPGSIFTGSATGSYINLLSGLTSGGTYTIDIRFAAVANRNGAIKTTYDPSGDYFYANFYVTPPPTTPPGGTTTWQSTTTTGGSTNWNLPENWSNGVPTRFSNAVIPSKTNSTIVYPILNSPTATHEVNNLTLLGNQSSAAAQLTINTATLRVYGNISQVAGGLAGNTTGTPGVADAVNNSTLILAGADQVITGNLLVSDIIVAGSGIKSVINQLTPVNILVFQPANATAGVLVQSAAQDVSSGNVNTVFDTTGNSYIQLVSSSTISTLPGQGETTTSYIKGVTRADRQVTASVQNTFGNIGLDITANHTPGNIVVYRVVGDALTGPVSSTAVPVKRQYKVVGDDNSGTNVYANSRIDVVFHYLDSPDELNTIQESNLVMFRTVTNGAPYQPITSSLDANANTVSAQSLNSLPNFTLTLGDRTNPLPVVLVSFSATRSGANAQLVWATASEKNNKGFEVQVSADGKSFRTLDFVASQGSNSANKLDYSYTDTEAGKTGIRYYRLHQLDLDGTDTYSPVRVVSFDGDATLASELSIYPNPVTGSEVHLLIQTAEVGTAHLRITDLMGRMVLNQDLATANGSSDTRLTELANAKSGTYLAQLTLPSGQVKTIKIQKQ